jgi:hypothetical protein
MSGGVGDRLSSRTVPRLRVHLGRYAAFICIALQKLATLLSQNCLPGKSAKTCPALRAKIFRLTRRANHLYKLAPSHPRQGRFANVTNARWDAMDATASARAGDRRAGFPVSDRTARGRTTLPTDLAGARRAARVHGRIFGRGGRGRRSRVVLAPRCWRQVLRRRIRPNRVFGCIKFRKATVSKSPVTGESSK